MKADDRAKMIDRAIYLAYDSLKSHLPYTFRNVKGEDKLFHKKCVAEYAEIIQILSQLY